MEAFADLDKFLHWLTEYGSFALFLLLALGLIALPIPEETLMILAGILISQNKINFPETIAAAYLGSICGITGSYLIGRTAGLFFLEKYGKWVGIKNHHIEKVHNWFEQYGKWTLPIGYFIPGVRHLTGLCAGVTKLNLKDFALFAFLGAFFWVSTFISIGYFFGDHWVVIYNYVESRLDDFISAGIALGFIGIGAYIYFKVKKNSRRSGSTTSKK